MKKWWKLLVAIGLCEGVGLLGSVMTLPAIGGWYQTLSKPSFTPPSWVFGPAWTILFFLMGMALYLVWNEKAKQRLVRSGMWAFGLQLLLNFLWSVLFFGLHSPLLALIDIVFLWLGILLTVMVFERISRLAANLLIPYILWVSFAMVLNFAIVLLN